MADGGKILEGLGVDSWFPWLSRQKCHGRDAALFPAALLQPVTEALAGFVGASLRQLERPAADLLFGRGL